MFSRYPRGGLNGHEDIAVDDTGKVHLIVVNEKVTGNFFPVGGLLLADVLGQGLACQGVNHSLPACASARAAS